jgi:radical SAM superfamily enzyme YgiQ (UPF0313 family)
MKILLIYPPKEHEILTNVPRIIEEETGRYPPLGLLYLASYLKEQTTHKVEVLDAQIEKLSYEALRERIRLASPDLVGIQAFTFTLIDAILVARLVKEVNSKIIVCLGGPHPSIYPQETARFSEVDFVIKGEGEYSFLALLKALEGLISLNRVPGLYYKEGSQIISGPPQDFIKDLDRLPFPQRQMLPFKRYYSVLARHQPITTIISSRGCPFKCLFCDRPHLGKAFRSRCAQDVVDEMETCLNLGIKEIFFYDDTFTVDRKRALDICDEIIGRRISVNWDIRTRVDLVDRQLLERLRRAGCLRIHYGVEAGTEKILRVLRKQIDLRQTQEIFKISRQLGITTLAYFMIGSPTETGDDILETINFAIRLNPDFVHFSVTTPFPGTELYRQGLERGILKYDYWGQFARDPRENFLPAFWEENLSHQELLRLLRLAYRRFYARPGYIIKELLRVKGLGEFKKKVKAGLKVVGIR